jgi:hypothetical protein
VTVCCLPQNFDDRMKDIIGDVTDTVPPKISVNSKHIEQLRYIRRHIDIQAEKDIINSWIGQLTDYVQVDELMGQRSSSVNSSIQIN